MNERIYKLAQEAGFSTWVLNPSKETMSDTPELLKKFAELIVRECADAIAKDSRLNDVRSAANGCVRTIKEHFGVEE